MARYVTEFIGTFFLVLTIGLTVLAGEPMAPLAIGSALMVMVYMGGHVSGAHYNPAVTLAVLMRNKLSSRDAVAYWVAQLLGAVAAGLVVVFATGKSFPVAPAATATQAQALLLEALFTFALALVVLNTAVSEKTRGNSYFGLAIGITVMVGAFAAGPISGGAFNPAVGVGPSLVHAARGEALAPIWIYLAGPLTGAALAAWVFGLQEGKA